MVRLLVVGDDPLARAGLAALLAGRADVTVAGQSPPEDAGRNAVACGAAVALWDLGSSGAAPGLGSFGADDDGGEPPRGLAAAALRVVALAARDDQAAAAVRAGARGVLLRGADADAIAAAVAAVAEGLVAIDGGLARGWLRPPEPAGAAEGLTAREREVLGLLAEGLPNKSIAARLGISEHTAKFHVNAILGKLGVESRAEAIVRAARLGIVAL